ncbi:MAG: YitT family protein [Lachnospiraceae bacterium]|uniref:YitT family protein n=1 Tax=Parablautia sp. Marseille-Q6255 TaxID=3039593 RepID=UPI0024BC052F|nr:YitT family protein [Parablautia sp. Marseille-Q6255]
MVSSLTNNKKQKEFLVDILCDIAGSILYSVGIYTFAKTADFAPGGISGLALIMNHLWGLPIGTMSLVLNIPLILISYKICGRSFMIKSLRTMLFCTFFLDIVFPFTPAYTGSPLMAALYSGVFIGAALAIFYSRGTSSGGTDFLTVTIKVLRPHLSIGVVTMAIDLFIIALGGPVFRNVDAILYGLLTTFITSITIDKIMFGMASGALAIIITDKGQEIADRIGTITGRGSTAIRAMGTYTKQDRDVLLCACSDVQSHMVIQTVHEIDENAFIMMTNTSQVLGEGFIEKTDKKQIF